MREEEENLSLKSMPERRASPLRQRANPCVQNMDDQNTQTINFLTHSTFLKLKNLTNLPELHNNSTDQEIKLLLQRIAELEAKVNDL